jgi:hypothetical protein
MNNKRITTFLDSVALSLDHALRDEPRKGFSAEKRLHGTKLTIELPLPFRSVASRVADPHLINANPDPAFLL